MNDNDATQPDATIAVPDEVAEHVRANGGRLSLGINGEFYWEPPQQIGESYVYTTTYEVVSDEHYRTEDGRLLRRDRKIGLAEIESER